MSNHAGVEGIGQLTTDSILKVYDVALVHRLACNPT